MRSDTDGDDNKISEYHLLMKSLACQLQNRDSVCECTRSTPAPAGVHTIPVPKASQAEVISSGFKHL